MPEGSEFLVEFTVAGLPVIGLNAGPEFKLDEAFSFYLSVETQDDVDRYWALLTADGGEPGPCGWCEDRFGVLWLSNPDPPVGGTDHAPCPARSIATGTVTTTSPPSTASSAPQPGGHRGVGVGAAALSTVARVRVEGVEDA